MLNLRINSALASRRMATAAEAGIAAGQYVSSNIQHSFGVSGAPLQQHWQPCPSSNSNPLFHPIVQNQPLPLGWSSKMDRDDHSVDQAHNDSPTSLRGLYQQISSTQTTPAALVKTKPEESLGSATASSRVGGSNSIVSTSSDAAGGERKPVPVAAAVVAADTGRSLRSSRPSNSSSNASSTREADPDWVPSNMAQSSTTASSAKKQKKTAAKAASPDNVDVTAEKSMLLQYRCRRFHTDVGRCLAAATKTRTRIPSEKRKMQNRHNQRAFRQRREQVSQFPLHVIRALLMLACPAI